MWAGIQADSEDDQTGQSEIGDPLQQLSVLRKSELEYYAMLLKIGVHHYSGHNTGLPQHVKNTTEYAHWLLLNQMILMLLETCKNRLEK